MAFVKREAQIDWRQYVTADEAKELAEIDSEVAAIDARRQELSFKLNLFRGRCYKRARSVPKVAA